MLDCDSDLHPLVEEQLKADLSLKTGRIFRLMPGKGLGAFDAWLDKRWDNPGILVAITLSLSGARSVFRSEPRWVKPQKKHAAGSWCHWRQRILTRRKAGYPVVSFIPI